MAQPEADLKRAIVEALHRCGVWCFRNEQLNHGKYKGGCGVGSPDILVVLRPTGRLLGLEVKTPWGRGPTTEQFAWGDMLVENGGAWACVRSVAEAIEAVRKAGGRAA